ncbi:MAG TPA: glycine zipper 2TM domain-containing protein [Qipengyuania sp.]|nr:glycine zipper 2TM domain-containing protein [Qipengyuania sp.]
MFTQKLRIAALAFAAGGLTLATPAAAVPAAHSSAWANTPAHGAMTVAYHDDDDDDRRWGRRDRYERREARRYAREQRRYERQQQRYWRGDDGRYYCRKSDGTTGMIVGGAAGALLGREIAGRNGDRTLGAILGAAGGALLGKSIDSKVRCN